MKFDNHTLQNITYMETYIHVEVNGIITMESSFQNFMDINEAVNKYDCYKLLMENNIENTLTLEDALGVCHRLVEQSVLNIFNSKCAFVVLEEQFEQFKTYESMLITMNIDAKIFLDKVQAIEWLNQ